MATSKLMLTKEQWAVINDLAQKRISMKVIHIEDTNLKGTVAVGFDNSSVKTLINVTGKTMVV